jgi:ATP-dependent Clp protease ATP-binding subunit ClpA
MSRPGTTPSGWFTPDAEAAWRAANVEALDLGHPWLGTEHLLLGLLHGPAEDPAVRILAAADVTRERVHMALVRELGAARPDDAALLATLGIDLAEVRARVEASFGANAIAELYARRRREHRRLARGPLCGLAMMPRAKLALERARRAAKTEHRSQVGSTDLLVGLLNVEDGMAVRLLRMLGADTHALGARLRPRAAG